MKKTGKPVMAVVLLIAIYFGAFQACFGAQGQSKKKQKTNSKAGNGFGSVVFPVTGNVYPKGYYHVTVNIGHPPKPYLLDIDSGSDLTWLQCDAPCAKCTPAPHSLYKPNKDLVACQDPLCSSVSWPLNKQCENPDEQCDYEVQYADHGLSMGVLVRDSFKLRFTYGSVVSPRLAFGCGYHQEVPDSVQPPYTDGVLGLSNGKTSIISQLHALGLTRNVLGHCLSTKGGGFLFFGDDLVPSKGVVWTPVLHNSLEKHYEVGPVELLYGKQATGVKDLPVVFDSGSTYSYFSSDAYSALLSTLKKNLDGRKLKDAVEDRSLPVCWKGSKPFKSIRDVAQYFKPLVLSFTKVKNVQLQLPPEAYLIITEHGNVCLGILNGTEVGLGSYNVLGDLSLQDKMVIYDNEKQQIGWLSADCNRLTNLDGDSAEEEFSETYAANMGILEEATRGSDREL